MTAILTLLFVSNPGEVCSPFLAPLRAAAPRLLVEHRAEEIKVLLTRGPVDAILVDHDHLQDSMVAELKRIAPRTPVVLLRPRTRPATTKPPGIAAVLSADPEDRKLLSTVLTFLAFILGKWALNLRDHRPVQSGIEKGVTVRGRVRGRTKNECWRNYTHDKRTSGGVLLDVIPNNKQEAYATMKRDNLTGIWMLEFVFTNVD